MQFDQSKRREFIAVFGGAAAAWPLVARAQQSAMPVIGYLHSAWPEPYVPMIAAFRQGLAEAGYIEGQNVRIEYRWAEGQLDRLPSMAAELVGYGVAALVTGGADAPVYAAKAATTTIPIVFTIGGDPVQYHLVDSIAHPLGNVTGVTFFTITLGPKRLEILRELVPKATTIAVLVDPRASQSDANEVQEAARGIGQTIHILHAGSEQDIDAGFRSLVEQRAEALLIVSSPLFTARREQIVTLANYHRIPAVYSLREFVASGGLISLWSQHQGCLWRLFLRLRKGSVAASISWLGSHREIGLRSTLREPLDGLLALMHGGWSGGRPKRTPRDLGALPTVTCAGKD